MNSQTQNAYQTQPRGRFVYATIQEAQRDGFAVYDPHDSEGNVVLRRMNAQQRFELAIVRGRGNEGADRARR